MELSTKEPSPAELKLARKKIAEISERNHGRKLTYKSRYHTIKGYEQNKLVALLRCRIIYDMMYIELLWVDESIQKQGHGKRLLQEAYNKAKDLGLLGVEVWTYSYQAPNFYPKHGYQLVHLMNDYIPGVRFYGYRKLITR